MSTNSYFNNFNYQPTQNVVEDLIIQAIKIYGYSMYYVPRQINNLDEILGEDPLSSFTQAPSVEMYIKNVEGFGGSRFMSKFNLEIRDTVTFSVSKLRFEQIVTEKTLLENSYVLVNEDGGYMLLDNTDNPFTISYSRPREGDLVFFPLMNKIFEIKYVNYETIFYQTGSLQVYDLDCELFEYGSERITTGIDIIDNIETIYSADVRSDTLLVEDGTKLVVEDWNADDPESFYINEDAVPNLNDKTANNVTFTTRIKNFVDSTEEDSPFITDGSD